MLIRPVAVALVLVLSGCTQLVATPVDTDTGGPTLDPCAGTVVSCDPANPDTRIETDSCGTFIAVVSTCADEETCVDEDATGMAIPAECVEDCGDPQTRRVCSPADPSATYWADGCGAVGAVADTCPGIWECIDGEAGADADCGCADIVSDGRCYNEQPGLYFLNLIAPENVCGSVNTDPDDALEICPSGTRCETLFGGPPACERSLTDLAIDSPYYDNGCGVFSEYLEVKTNLGADCRCRHAGDGGDPNNVFGDGDVVDPFTGLRPNGKIPNCMNGSRWPNETWPLDYGSGQTLRALAEVTANNSNHHGGAWLPATRELVSLMQWTRPEFGTTATVVAFQVDTGARRVISGIYPDPDPAHITQPGWMPYDTFLADRATTLGAEFAYTDPTDPDNASIDIDFAHWGSGHVSQSRLSNQAHLQPLSGGSSIKLGPDGMLYVAGFGTGQGSSKRYEVVRVHPTTGHRELVWKSQYHSAANNQSGDISATFGQCFRHDSFTASAGYEQSVAITNYSLSVAADSSLYLTFDDADMGSGLLHVSADGSTCDFVSRFGAEEAGGITPPDIGTGYTPAEADYYYGTLLRDGRVYAVRAFQNELVSFDVVTGDRVLESAPPATGYSGIGYMNMWFDETQQLLYTVGGTAGSVGSAIQLGTGLRQSLFADGAGAPLRVHSRYSADRDIGQGLLGHGNGLYRGAAFVDPDNPDLMYHTLEPAALAVLEFSTFNGMILSWDSQTPVTPLFP